MKIVFSRKYTVPPRGHVFRSGKFEAALNLLLKEGAVCRAEVAEPRRPSEKDLLLAHSPAWAGKLISGRLTGADWEAAELGPRADILEAQLMNAGGTILAARHALRRGLGINCGGGAHHAFADRGEGFCLVNDIALAVNKLREEKKIRRALIIDLDAHQGNGTAAIFKGDGDICTFSMHQKGLYPERREKSSLDIELPPGTGDADYLAILGKRLPPLFGRASPDLAVYNAGVDVCEGDLRGGLKLTMRGVRARDEMVFGECFRRGVPALLVLSGGYAGKPSVTARLHANTIKSALEKFNTIRARG